MIDRSGDCLDNYRLLRLLGRGGFAEVYLGEHLYLRTQAAIKILQAHLWTPGDQQQFLKEAQIVAGLSHPHIVRVLDFGMDGEIPYLVMDYAFGGTLRQRHRRGAPLELATVTRYVLQIAEALQYIHDVKLIHRDVKPENILVDKHSQLLLSDFGIALVAHSSHSQSTQSAVGTVAYMSPEQIKGQPRPQSDQYSLAVVAYEWLSGQRPFTGSFTELCTQHLFAPVPSLRAKVPALPLEVERVIMTALAKDPKERFATVQAFSTALAQASRNEPVVVSSKVVSAPPPLAPSPSPNQPAVVAAQQPKPSEQLTPAVQAPTLPATNVIPPLGRISRRTLLTAGSIGVGAVVLGSTFLVRAISQAPRARSPLATPTPPRPKNPLFRYQGHKLTLLSLLWSPDGTRLLSADKETVQVWDAFDGKHASLYHIPQGSSINVTALAWTPKGPCLAWGDNTTNPIHVTNVVTGQEMTVYRGHANAPESIDRFGSLAISWSPDGTRIASCKDSGTHVWDASTGQTLSAFVPPDRFEEIDKVAWAPNGSRIASPGNHGLIYVWDAATGQQVCVFNKHTAELYSVGQYKMGMIDPVVWASNSQQICSIASNNPFDPKRMTRVWDARTGKQIFAKQANILPISSQVVWSPQSSLIAVELNVDRSPLQIWDASDGEIVLAHFDDIAFAWAPDGKRIASGGESLNVWDATTEAHLVSYTDHSYQNSALAWSLVWSPDGKYIATGGQYGTIDIWQV